MYAKYFNHHRTENALLHRGADQKVEATNGMKWANVVSDVPKCFRIRFRCPLNILLFFFCSLIS